jgi:hypothetical protein
LSPGKVKNFLVSTSSRPALWPTQPPIQWVPGAFSPGVKQPGLEPDHSPPVTADVKKNIDLYVYSPIRLHGVVLLISKGQFYFLPLSYLIIILLGAM